MNLGIYIQVPFCQTKCTYCNFHTGVVSAEKYAPYVAAVQSEIRNRDSLFAAAGIPAGQSGDGVVDTVYFGGGTPSLLDPSHLQSILDAIRASFSCDWKEVTLEADPEMVLVAVGVATRQLRRSILQRPRTEILWPYAPP